MNAQRLILAFLFAALVTAGFDRVAYNAHPWATLPFFILALALFYVALGAGRKLGEVR